MQAAFKQGDRVTCDIPQMQRMPTFDEAGNFDGHEEVEIDRRKFEGEVIQVRPSLNRDNTPARGVERILYLVKHDSGQEFVRADHMSKVPGSPATQPKE